MRIEWWIATIFVIISSVCASVFLSRHRKFSAARAVAIAVLAYATLFTILWGMASSFIRSPGVEIPRPVKRIILAIAGGLLAQLIIILDRFVRGQLSRARVSMIYARGVIGLLAGVVGLLIASIGYSSVERVDDPQAVLWGIVGGALGASVLDLARKRMLGDDKK